MNMKIPIGVMDNDEWRTLLVDRTHVDGWMVLYDGEYAIHSWMGTAWCVAAGEEEAGEVE